MVGRHLLERLRDRDEHELLFARDLSAPFTNNRADRDVRPTKTQLKISGCHLRDRCDSMAAHPWLHLHHRQTREISLDTFTVELLRGYLAMLDEERAAFGPDYDTSHSLLMRYEDGCRLHADTMTRRFNRLVDLAGVRRIRPHDIRHT